VGENVASQVQNEAPSTGLEPATHCLEGRLDEPASHIGRVRSTHRSPESVPSLVWDKGGKDLRACVVK
jgi:hypothetical protein